MLCAIKPVTIFDRFEARHLLGLLCAAIFVLSLLPGAVQATTDVTDYVDVEFDKINKKWKKQKYHGTMTVTNTSAADITGPLRLTITEFQNQRYQLDNADGIDGKGDVFVDIDLPNGVLAVGETTEPLTVKFSKIEKKEWKQWRKARQKQPASKEASLGWADHNFPIKFNYAVQGNFPDVELTISQPDAVPGALKIGQGEVTVRVTTSVFTNVDVPISPILLRQVEDHNGCDEGDEDCCYYDDECCYYDECCYDDDCCYYDECCYDDDCCYYEDDCCDGDECGFEEVLNDDGINGDLEPNDGIYTFETVIDTDELESGECLSFVAEGATELGGKVVSEELLLCATRFNTELIEIDPSEDKIIKLNGADVLGDQLLVRLEPGASTDALSVYLLRNFRALIVGSQPEDGLYQIAVDTKLTPAQLRDMRDALLQFGGVIGVDPNYVGEFTSVPDDPEFFSQHGLRLVSANSLGDESPSYVWEAGATGEGTRVLVIDSGVNTPLPDDLDPQADENKDTDDQLGHGSQMASIIAAPTDNATAIASIARDSRVRSIRLSKTNKITLTKMLNGFKRAKGFAGRNKVISASFSIRNMLSDGGVCNQINKIIDRGAVVVVSAGNDNSNAKTGIVPGNCNSPDFDIFTSPGPVSSKNKNSLIVVGSSSCSEGSCEDDSRWQESNNVGSNYGNWVDISAPGVSITTQSNDGSIVSIDGTSASTAMVAGGAAILRGCGIGGPLSSADGSAVDTREVFNALELGATTSVSGGLPNRMNLFNSLASVNTVPSDISLSNSVILTGTDTSGGYSVGVIGFDDDTVCDSHKIEITGGVHAEVFSIGGEAGNELIIDDGLILDQGTYDVEITVNDFYGQSVSGSFTIIVQGVLF